MTEKLRILRGVDLDAGTSRSRMQRKRLKAGWLKRVTGTDPTRKGGYQFDGEFYHCGDELHLADVLVNRTPENGYRVGITVPRSASKGDPETECVIRWTLMGVDTAVARRECERLLEIPQEERQEATKTDSQPKIQSGDDKLAIPLADRLQDATERRQRGTLSDSDAKLLIRDLLTVFPGAGS